MRTTLAAAILTAVAVGTFVLLETQRNKSRDTGMSVVNAFLVLVGWLIGVPLLGFVIEMLGEALDFVGHVLGFMGAGVAFFYRRYDEQPIVVLVLFALALIGYAVWEWRNPPRRVVRRGTITVAAFLLLVALTVPIFNFLTPAKLKATASAAAGDAK